MKPHLQMEKNLVEQDPYRLVRGGYLKIKVKKPGQGDNDFIRFFHPKPPQEKLIKLIERLRKEEKPPRIWILKARQIGFSTLSEALIFSYTSQRKGRNACIIADDLKGTNYLFEMYKTYHSFLERDFPHLAPPIDRSNRKEMVFQHMYSGIYPDTADNEDAGQKYTFVDVHWSEVALFNKAQILFDGFMQSMPDHPETLFIGESTAQGYGGFFYDQVMSAYDNLSDWELFFVPWYDEPGYRKPLDAEQLIFLESTINKEEEALLEIHGCDFEQLWWRRWAIINKVSGGKNSQDIPKGCYLPDPILIQPLESFHEKYPASVEEAFIASGDCRFEKLILQKWLGQTPRMAKQNEMLKPRENYVEGYFFIDNQGFLDFAVQTGGYWKIFFYSEQGIDYAFGADVAEGIEVIEGSKDYDYSTIVILRRDTLEQVAEYRARIEPDLFALECFYGLMFFNTPVAGIEANKDGQTTIKFLREQYGYTNMFIRDVPDEERYNRMTKKLGWLTTGGRNKGTRHTMVNDMAKFIRDQEGMLYSKRAISECLSFVKKPDGRVEHQDGCHDDLVFAAGIAIQMHLKSPHSEAWTQRRRLSISYR